MNIIEYICQKLEAAGTAAVVFGVVFVAFVAVMVISSSRRSSQKGSARTAFCPRCGVELRQGCIRTVGGEDLHLRGRPLTVYAAR